MLSVVDTLPKKQLKWLQSIGHHSIPNESSDQKTSHLSSQDCTECPAMMAPACRANNIETFKHPMDVLFTSPKGFGVRWRNFDVTIGSPFKNRMHAIRDASNPPFASTAWVSSKSSKTKPRPGTSNPLFCWTGSFKQKTTWPWKLNLGIPKWWAGERTFHSYVLSNKRCIIKFWSKERFQPQRTYDIFFGDKYHYWLMTHMTYHSLKACYISGLKRSFSFALSPVLTNLGV